MTAILILCAALQAAKPEKPLDKTDARSVLEHAIYNTRSEPAYQTAFKSRLQMSVGDPFVRTGTCMWKSPGILSLHYTGAGGEEVSVLRAGASAWIHGAQGIKEWVEAPVANMDSAGRGLENPDDTLEVLSKHVAQAKFGKGGIELGFTGKDLAGILKDRDEVDFSKSSVKVAIEVDPNTRLKRLSMKAELQPKDPKAPAGTCEATIDVTDYNGKAPLKAVNAKGKELPFTGAIQKAIEELSSKK